MVRKLIAGPTVFICDECVGLCNDIMSESDAEKRTQDAADAVQKLLNAQFSEISRRLEALEARPARKWFGLA